MQLITTYRGVTSFAWWKPTRKESILKDSTLWLNYLKSLDVTASVLIAVTLLQVKRKSSEGMPFGDQAHIKHMCIELSSGLQLLVSYSSPKVPKKDAFKTIISLTGSKDPSNNLLLVLGDFNLQLLSALGKALVSQMEIIHFEKISSDGPSTD